MASAKRKHAGDGDDASAKHVKVERQVDQGDQKINQQKTSSLLGIPPELRNKIMAEVLVPGEDLSDAWRHWGAYDVSRNSRAEPAILHTRRQLRDEGLQMFGENYIFYLEIDALKLEPQLQHWVWKVTDGRPMWYFTGPDSKSNFMQWLKRFFLDQSVPRVDYPGAPEVLFENNVARVFDIVAKLAERNMTWSEAEDVLEPVLDFVQDALNSGRYGGSFAWMA